MLVTLGFMIVSGVVGSGAVTSEPAPPTSSTFRSPNGAFEVRFDARGGTASSTAPTGASPAWSVEWTPQASVLVANDGEHVVRTGREQLAERRDRALIVGFYKQGRLLRAYTNDDLFDDRHAGPCKGSFPMLQTAVHWIDGASTAQVGLTTYDGIAYVFDVRTGKIVERNHEPGGGPREVCREYVPSRGPPVPPVEPAAWASLPPTGAELVRLLVDDKLRDAALCRLFEMRDADDKGSSFDPSCRVSHVVRVPQEDGTTLHVVFHVAEWMKEQRLGEQSGPFELFDDAGRNIRVALGANMLHDADDVVFHSAKSPDAGAMVVQTIGYDGGGNSKTLNVLTVVPVTAAQRVALRIAMGGPHFAYEIFDPSGSASSVKVYEPKAALRWRARDVNGDGLIDIVLERTNDNSVAASFKWNRKTRSYDGPAGGKRAGFMRMSLEHDAFWKQMDAWNKKMDPCTQKNAPKQCGNDDTGVKDKAKYAGSKRVMMCAPADFFDEVVDELTARKVPKADAVIIAGLCAGLRDAAARLPQLITANHRATKEALVDFLLHRGLLLVGHDELLGGWIGAPMVTFIQAAHTHGDSRVTMLASVAAELPRNAEVQACYADTLLLERRFVDAEQIVRGLERDPPRRSPVTAEIVKSLRARLLAAEGKGDAAKAMMPPGHAGATWPLAKKTTACEIAVGRETCSFAAALFAGGNEADAAVAAGSGCGELSAGYVVSLSSDGGKTWGDAMHTGLAVGFPYAMRTTSIAPVFDGDVLQLPVDVREIVENRILRVPIAILVRDADNDGLVDLVEERLGTDPKRKDTDGDGVGDADDLVPLEAATATAPEATGAARLLIAAMRENDRKNRADAARMSSTPSADGVARPSTSAIPVRDLKTVFVDVDMPLPHDLVSRTINLRAVRDAYQKKFGVVYLTSWQMIASPDGKRAVVHIDAGWRGTTMLVEEGADGRIRTQILGSFIP